MVFIQYKGVYIIEINPRFSTFIYTDTWNESWVIFDYLLGNQDIDVLSKKFEEKPSGIRMVRYCDQLFYI